jgi:diguanylate cyclase (GGDEF)-like protein
MMTEEGPAGELERVPTPLARFVCDQVGYILAEANSLATSLLGATVGELSGFGFAGGLFDDDRMALAALLTSADAGPSETVLLRWGTSPPVMFLGVRVQRGSDNSVVASFHDLTDQYRLDTVLNGQGSGVIFTDVERRITWVSPLTAVTIGVPAKMLIGTPVHAGVHPDDAAEQVATTAQLLANPGVEIVRSCRSRPPLGKGSWWTMRFTQMYLPDDPAVGGITLQAELVVDANSQPAGTGAQSQMSLDEMLPGGLIMVTAGRVSFRSKFARKVFGAAITGPDAYAWIDSLCPRYRSAVLDLVHSAEMAGQRGATVAAVDRPSEADLWLRIETMPTLDVDGKPTGYAATLLDVTAETEARASLEQAQRQLWHLANHDALTALPNRMQFNDCLDRALTRKRRDSQNVALMFCDVDYFKPVNDLQGHQAGDSVLIEIARRLRSVTRATDTVCRIGGDEFGIVCEAFSDLSGLEMLAQRLVDIVAQPILLGLTTAQVGLSVGVAVAGPDSTDERLLSLADVALYQAKASGRGRFVMSR